MFTTNPNYYEIKVRLAESFLNLVWVLEKAILQLGKA